VSTTSTHGVNNIYEKHNIKKKYSTYAVRIQNKKTSSLADDHASLEDAAAARDEVIADAGFELRQGRATAYTLARLCKEKINKDSQ